MGWSELMEAMLRRLPSSPSKEKDLTCTVTISRKLLTAAIDPPFKPAVQRDLPAALLAAIGTGNSKCLRVLLDAGANAATTIPQLLLDTRNSQGFTVLMQTASHDDVDCMSVLLQHSPEAQVAAAALDGRSALMLAAERGHASSLQLLLAHSPHDQVSAVDGLKWNALMRAAVRGHKACVQLLLQHSPEVQVAAIGDDGSNALMCAAFYGHSACVQLLLSCCPHIQLAASDGLRCNALMYVASNAHADCMQLLLEHGASQQQLDKALLLVSRRLARLKAQPPATPEQHDQGLRCVELLLAKGAKLSSQAKDEDYAIMGPIIHELVNRCMAAEVAQAQAQCLAFASAGHEQETASVIAT